jgi:tetratricopeptide (TPR) repeat protein
VIPALALLLAAAPGPADTRPTPERFEACVKQSDTNPAAAQKIAAEWASSGGGVPAAQCLGIARSAAGDWKGAADAFVVAAGLAEGMQDKNAPSLWVSAGNAALAGGDPSRAKAALGNAINTPGFAGLMRGEAFLDRARAGVALNDLASARGDMNEALRLAADDPMAWLLSATLARRMGDTTRATSDIEQAATRAPNDPDVLFESGNIAAAAGDIAKARGDWTKAAAADPKSPAAESARAELAANGGDAPKRPAAATGR